MQKIIKTDEEWRKQLTDDEKAEAAKMVDRQLDRAVNVLRGTKIYEERQKELKTGEKKADGAGPAPAQAAAPAPAKTDQGQ